MHTAAEIFDDVLLFILSAQAVVDFDLQSNIIPRTFDTALIQHANFTMYTITYTV